MHKATTADILRKLMADDPEIDGNAAELARRTGLNQPTIQRILTGQSEEPRRSTLEPLADYFEVPVAYLQGEVDLQVKEANAPYAAALTLKNHKNIAAAQELIDLFEAMSANERATLMRLAEALPAPKKRAPKSTKHEGQGFDRRDRVSEERKTAR